MNALLRKDAETILRKSIAAVQPDAAVKRALQDLHPGSGRVFLVSVGKAAWQMARAALDCLGDQVDSGVVISKCGYPF